MTHDEVISRFCALSGRVMREVYGRVEAADCFCGENMVTIGSYQFSENILEFIEQAVDAKIGERTIQEAR